MLPLGGGGAIRGCWGSGEVLPQQGRAGSKVRRQPRPAAHPRAAPARPPMPHHPASPRHLPRSDQSFSGRPSYGNTYSAVNAMAGHLNSFGPTAPVPKKRLERMVKVWRGGAAGLCAGVCSCTHVCVCACGCRQREGSGGAPPLQPSLPCNAPRRSWRMPRSSCRAAADAVLSSGVAHSPSSARACKPAARGDDSGPSAPLGGARPFLATAHCDFATTTQLVCLMGCCEFSQRR